VAVIEVVPLVVGHALSEGGVMAESHISEMVGHGEAVVDQLVLLALLSTEDVVTHVKAVQGEIDKGF